MKNHYPLSRIDDFFDQIKDAKVFSKIDLKSRYPQLHIHEAYIYCIAFDIRTEEEHEEHMQLVLQCLLEKLLYINVARCEFFLSEVKYFGHVISRESIAVDPSKIQVIVDWPTPTNLGEILKEYLTSAPILAVPNPLGNFVVCTNASLEGLGVFFMQDGCVIAYELCKLKDQRVIRSGSCVKQQRWMEFLCQYDFELKYIQGKENMVVDALSHKRNEVVAVVLSVDLRSRNLSSLQSDAWYQEVREEIAKRRPLDDRYIRYSLDSDGLLCHMGCIYVPPSYGLQALILSKAHRAPYSAHLGVKKMHMDLQHLYHWVDQGASFLSSHIILHIRVNGSYRYGEESEATWYPSKDHIGS
ncbi:uncharacterized protein LOC131874326 [Cryptomeria japonica]|uniref:uncharacterized protein LOC131874326 n=1 Tax=Cryptomeria japonica TaxID=3369 RepID=UPI0027DA5AB8|nr:uncharacterized protein LOC131874326 [Cryptomeria japonica]